MSNNWKKLMGYDPGEEMKRMILTAVRDEGITLAEACARYAMPPLLIGDEVDPEYDNPFRPAIKIVTREN